MSRRLAWTCGVIIAVVVVLIFAAPVWLANNAIRPYLASRLSSRLGRSVHIGRLSLSVLHGHVRVDDLTIADAAGFGSQPFATVPVMDAHIRMWPLLTGHVEVPTLEVDHPRFRLIRSRRGVWNVANLPPLMLPHVGQFALRDAVLALVGPDGAAAKIGLNLSASRLNLDHPFPVHFAASVDGRPLEGSGRVGPLRGGAGKAPVQMSVAAPSLSAVALARMAAIAGHRPSGFAISSGRVVLHANVNGVLAHPGADAHVVATGVDLRRLQLGGSAGLAQFGMTAGTGEVTVPHLETTLSYEQSTFKLSHLAAQTNFGTVQAHGHIAPNGRLRFLLNVHISAAPRKAGLNGLIAALARLFEKAKDPVLNLEVVGTTSHAQVRQLQ